MADAPIRYATARDGVQIAYRILGSGPIDVVWVNGFASNLDLNDGSPLFGDFENRLPRIARVVEFDKRGSGLSDHTFGSGAIEDRIDDIRAVMDAAGVGRAALQGAADGGPIAMGFAAMYPERVSSLVLHGTWARIAWAPDYEIGVEPDVVEPILQFVEQSWGGGDVLSMFTGRAINEAEREVLGRVERSQGTPKRVAAQMRVDIEIDVRDALPLIDAPTLVLQSPDGTSTFPSALGRHLVEQIAGARCVEVPQLWDSTAAVDAVEEFLTGLPPSTMSTSERVLATVLFTDIVGSTSHAARLGDADWRQLLDAHDEIVRAQLARFGGHEVDTTGDGFFATFDGPARALRCAEAITEAVRTVGLEIRAGVHTGEVTRRGDGYAGMAVHIGARVMAVAGASEVVTTSTVRDLVIGSGLEFDDRGTHTLKGVDGSWQLVALRT